VKKSEANLISFASSYFPPKERLDRKRLDTTVCSVGKGTNRSNRELIRFSGSLLTGPFIRLARCFVNVFLFVKIRCEWSMVKMTVGLLFTHS